MKRATFTTGLTPAQTERFALLGEELCEAGQVVGKIQRHGLDSQHPHTGYANRYLLEQELGDVLYAIKLCCANFDLDVGRINRHALLKGPRVAPHLHHAHEGAYAAPAVAMPPRRATTKKRRARR